MPDPSINKCSDLIEKTTYFDQIYHFHPHLVIISSHLFTDLSGKMKIERTDVGGGRCIRGNDGTLYLNEKDRAKLWKEHMSKIMNDHNEWDQIADADTVEGPIERVMGKEIMEAFKYLK